MASQLKPEVQAERQRAIRPLFAYLEARGIKQNWLAKEMKISAARLWNYAHGINPPPDWFIERACQILGIPPIFLNIQLPPPPPRRRTTAKQATITMQSRERTAQKGAATDGRKNSSRRPRKRKSAAAETVEPETRERRELAAQGA